MSASGELPHQRPAGSVIMNTTAPWHQLALLTDAEVAAALKLEIGQFQSALRRGLIPAPQIIGGRRRWTSAQLRAILGEAVPIDKDAAEAMVLEAIDRAAAAKKA